MGQAITWWVWLPAPIVTRQSTFKIHVGDLQRHPVPLRAAQWYQFEQSRTKRICSVPITTTQYAAVTHLAAQRLKAGQAGMLPAPEQPVMTRGTTITFTM
ncbi:hypothetical protein [Lactiplantibacillus plantarum]|uniref:hypothetical protein n=1 Tax=Lactiplantibacillus plantarum TaxID=1590 RepID=UPI000C8027F2|nr:hypothetical protein [Lactiplantibacillus plantarum]MDN7090043.1 hypothetical protein [Lactiplantibacillus plantarum]PME03285.1 hypothetical protein S101520_00431 [Lactiplantibacillus plantarum subsp. plantarum]